jgi:hypothetical protein
MRMVVHWPLNDLCKIIFLLQVVLSDAAPKRQLLAPALHQDRQDNLI